MGHKTRNVPKWDGGTRNVPHNNEGSNKIRVGLCKQGLKQGFYQTMREILENIFKRKKIEEGTCI